ncbi:SRPBCC family protein [Citrobacter freundii]|uniref:SRPBCC family protein n=1 Tax=Citrobacter TaxID=544 RepID=UPI00214D96E0|nr:MULTISPECIES: SRPBCC family protein [Citrobacter]MCR3713747.1 SRPBCC family protein [Citrobacter freundii]MDM3231785.1 SRPBCC family protein [Citrobacter sp. Cf078]
MANVNYNALIDVDSSQVWQTLKAFGDISQWHPAIVQSSISDDKSDGVPGCIRTLSLTDGTVLLEKLLSMDDHNLQFSYCFEESPLPVDNYIATIKVIPISGKKQAAILWSATFDLRQPDPEGTHASIIYSLIVSGHQSLQVFLQQKKNSDANVHY